MRIDIACGSAAIKKKADTWIKQTRGFAAGFERPEPHDAA
jgi:hypothetical protein